MDQNEDPKSEVDEGIVSIGRAEDFVLRDINQANARIERLEEKLLESRSSLAQAKANNEKLAYTVQQTREHLTSLRQEVEKLSQPPTVYGTFVADNNDGTVDIYANGRKMRDAGAEIVLESSDSDLNQHRLTAVAAAIGALK